MVGASQPCATRARFGNADGALLLGIGLAVLALYASRLCPTLCLFGDSAELTTAAALLGVPHPPGYPLLTLIAHGFTKLPWGELPHRVHLSSALFHAATVSVVAATLLRLTASRLAALSGAALLALARSFFLGSLYYEVFPLNDLLFALCLFLASRERGGQHWLALAFGLALAHHQMIVLALPALAVLLLEQRSAWRDPVRVGRAFLAAMTAFGLSYAILILAASRNPAANWGDVHDLPALLRVILRADYGGIWSASSRPSPWMWSARQFALIGTLQRSLGWSALIACVLAIWPLARNRPRWALSLLLAWVSTGPVFFAINRVGLEREEQLAFVERFSTMCHVPLALLFGFGVAWGQSQLAVRRNNWLAPVLASAVLLPALQSARSLDLSKDDRGRRYLHDLVASAEDGSLVMLAGDMAWTAAQYACNVERLCGRRRLLAPTRVFEWYLRQVRREQPDLVLPELQRLGSSRVHLIVTEALQRGPVYVHPLLLGKAPQLKRQFRVVPDLLLIELLSGEPDRATTLQKCRALAEGARCAGCQSFPADLPRPSTYAQVAAEYRAALLNNATLNAELGGTEDVTNRLLQLAENQTLPDWRDPALPTEP